MKCVVMTIVVPISESEVMRRQNWRRFNGSVPLVGSSRNRISGSCRKSYGHCQPLLESPGQLPARRIFTTLEVELPDDRFDAFPQVLVVQAVGAAKKLKILLYGKVAVQREFLSHVPNFAPCCGWRMAKVDTQPLAENRPWGAEARTACGRSSSCPRH